MGLGPSVFYVYARDEKTNRYRDDFIEMLFSNAHMNERHALGVFKREVHALALGKGYEGTKAIYLYHNAWRMARAGFEGGDATLRLDFRDEKTKHRWVVAEEKLGPRRWPLLERKFADKWAMVSSEETATSVSFARVAPGGL